MEEERRMRLNEQLLGQARASPRVEQTVVIAFGSLAIAGFECCGLSGSP